MIYIFSVCFTFCTYCALTSSNHALAAVNAFFEGIHLVGLLKEYKKL